MMNSNSGLNRSLRAATSDRSEQIAVLKNELTMDLHRQESPSSMDRLVGVTRRLMYQEILAPPERLEERDPVVDSVLYQGEVMIVQTIKTLVKSSSSSSSSDELLGSLFGGDARRRTTSFSEAVANESKLGSPSFGSFGGKVPSVCNNGSMSATPQPQAFISRTATTPFASLQYTLPVLPSISLAQPAQQLHERAASTGSTQSSDGSLFPYAANHQRNVDLQAFGRHAKLLYELGSKAKNEPYFDVASLEEPQVGQPARGGYSDLFPEKLHTMLETVEAEGLTSIVSFMSHGRAFRVDDVDKFCEQLLPRFFGCSKWGSWLRQLNLYGFRRVGKGPDRGAYYHSLFLRGRRTFSYFMQRSGKKRSKDSRTLSAADGRADPDFYALPPV